MSKHLSCEEVIERLLEFLDKELDAETERQIRSHMEICRACSSRAEFKRRLRERIVAVGETKAPDSLRRRVRAMLARF